MESPFLSNPQNFAAGSLHVLLSSGHGGGIFATTSATTWVAPGYIFLDLPGQSGEGTLGINKVELLPEAHPESSRKAKFVPSLGHHRQLKRAPGWLRWGLAQPSPLALQHVTPSTPSFPHWFPKLSRAGTWRWEGSLWGSEEVFISGGIYLMCSYAEVKNRPV